MQGAALVESVLTQSEQKAARTAQTLAPYRQQAQEFANASTTMISGLNATIRDLVDGFEISMRMGPLRPRVALSVRVEMFGVETCGSWTGVAERPTPDVFYRELRKLLERALKKSS